VLAAVYRTLQMVCDCAYTINHERQLDLAGFRDGALGDVEGGPATTEAGADHEHM